MQANVISVDNDHHAFNWAIVVSEEYEETWRALCLRIRTWGTSPSGPAIHHKSVLHISGNSYERFLNVHVLLRWCLKKMNVVFSGQGFSFLKWYGLQQIIVQVGFLISSCWQLCLRQDDIELVYMSRLTLWSFISHLLPINILLTFTSACWIEIHERVVKDDISEVSDDVKYCRCFLQKRIIRHHLNSHHLNLSNPVSNWYESLPIRNVVNE